MSARDAERIVLHALSRDPYSSPLTIRKHTGLTTSGVYAALMQLEHDELVAYDELRHARLYYPTAKGRALMRELIGYPWTPGAPSAPRRRLALLRGRKAA